MSKLVSPAGQSGTHGGMDMPVMQGLQYYNQKFNTMAEHWDDFLMDRVIKNPNIWHDRIPREAYDLYSGLEHKMNIFRGGLPVQAGLDTWRDIGISRKPGAGDAGYDNCNPGTPHTYDYAWETKTYTGYTDEWQSEPVCVEDMKYIDYAREQLRMVVRTGVDYGISILENWNREMYMNFANDASRLMILTDGALDFETDATYRFTYDPFLTTTDVDGDTVPYITFSADVRVSTLNFAFLDYLRVSMAERCGEAAIAQDGGLPVFGLMIDIMDFERMVQADDKLHEEFLYSDPKALIEGYSLGMKRFRGFGLMHDKRQPRFRIKGIDATTGKVVATRVKPLKAGRAVTIGNVPEPNPAYYQAPLGVGVLFMNDVFVNRFVPSVSDLGSGMTFGPAPGLTGKWQWVNIPDPVTNMLGETGFFYGRFQIFPKPLMFSNDTTCFLYTRCPHAWSTECEINSLDDVASASSAVSVGADAVTADYDDTLNRVTLTMASKMDISVNDPVSIVKADAAAFDATVADISLAPTYTFVYLEGAANEPSAYTDFTAAVSTVTKA
jgi:hypothetical protein